MVIKSFQMPIGNGHWESNFFNGYFSPIVVEKEQSVSQSMQRVSLAIDSVMKESALAACYSYKQ